MTLDSSAAVVLDLFAGVGVGVACRDLGLDEFAVDNAAAVQAVRAANGMDTPLDDVWRGIDDPDLLPVHDLQWGSPPCQTFTVAGDGAGRRALSEVLRLVSEQAYLRPADMRAFGTEHDERTALVLTPLTYAHDHLPRAIVLEQVPTVLPVWQAFEPVLESWGYSVAVALLHAEQYGVPQTRKRAILLARLDDEARMPAPTHSRYYPRDPRRRDAGLPSWRSMLDVFNRDVAMRSNYGTGGDPAARGVRTAELPAPTVTSKISRNRWQRDGAGNVTVAEAAALQAFPADFVWPNTVTRKAQYQIIGNAVPPPVARALLEEVAA